MTLVFLFLIISILRTLLFSLTANIYARLFTHIDETGRSSRAAADEDGSSVQLPISATLDIHGHEGRAVQATKYKVCKPHGSRAAASILLSYFARLPSMESFQTRKERPPLCPILIRVSPVRRSKKVNTANTHKNPSASPSSPLLSVSLLFTSSLLPIFSPFSLFSAFPPTLPLLSSDREPQSPAFRLASGGTA